MRLVVTRPPAQADALVAELQTLGADAVALPLIDIVPLADTAPLQRAWQALPDYALLMFVSANAVQQFMRAQPPGAVWPPDLLAGSTGPGTSAALVAAGVPGQALVEPTGEVFDSEALWQRLQGRAWQGRRVCVVRGVGGRDWLAEQLRSAGARVDFLEAYLRRPPVPTPAWQAALAAAREAPERHLWAFGSSEAVANLQALAPDADWSTAAATAPHPRIAAALRQAGFGRVALLPADARTLAAAAREGPPIQSAHP